MFSRYAIYYAPSSGPFATAGARWLGWDLATGSDTAQPDIKGLSQPFQNLTRTPARYGFHATLKPPFHLADATTFDAFLTDTHALCQTLKPVTLHGLQPTRLGRFLALTTMGDTAELTNLAAQIVTQLDTHRAPPSVQDIAKRKHAHLSVSQNTSLLRWGYPYVLDDFKFHMTLTEKLGKADLQILEDAVDHHFAKVIPNPLIMDHVILAGERPDRSFVEICKVGLGSNSDKSGPCTGLGAN